MFRQMCWQKVHHRVAVAWGDFVPREDAVTYLGLSSTGWVLIRSLCIPVSYIGDPSLAFSLTRGLKHNNCSFIAFADFQLPFFFTDRQIQIVETTQYFINILYLENLFV